MKIPSIRTRRDMEMVADLRAAGATWETAALKVQRRAGLLRRWAKVYAEEWVRLFREAEERLGREANKVTGMLLNSLTTLRIFSFSAYTNTRRDVATPSCRWSRHH
ncbi:MAG TPA: hypothetical protein VKS79_18630 [Gemmataceae bacterium]|nr:hypothetical protein [Gemmataceae bacterium]